MADPNKLMVMSWLNTDYSHGDFVVFGKYKRKRTRRRKTDPFFKNSVSGRNRRTKVRNERL